jgi:hypothetical protein
MGAGSAPHLLFVKEYKMKNSVAVPNRELILIHRGPGDGWPRSPRPPVWRGPTPPGVQRIIGQDGFRDVPNIPLWATNIALFASESIWQIVKRTSKSGSFTCQWKEFRTNLIRCNVGEDYLWLNEASPWGFTVELCYPSTTKPDARILTVENMPVVCRGPISAAQLAEASYPEPPANFAWHPFW